MTGKWAALRWTCWISVWALVLTTPVYAADGDLDPTFGTGGVVHRDIAGIDQGHALAIQPDGKIVVAGFAGATVPALDFAVARFEPDGIPDLTFDGDGFVTTDLQGGLADQAFAVALQQDGKIVVAGWSGASGARDFAMVRYQPNGALDPSFGAGGVVLTGSPGASQTLSAIAIQADGRIVVTGASNASGDWDLAVARYLTDGSLDPSFGAGGLATIDASGIAFTDAGKDVAIQADGKIVVAGFAAKPGQNDFAVARLHPNGTFDSSFGSGGVVVTDTSGSAQNDFAEALAIQSDGKIVVLGTYAPPGVLNFQAARYTTDGNLDPAFGIGGLVTTDLSGSGSLDLGFSLAIQSDGKIVAVGRSGSDFGLVRYDAAGQPDPSFGSGGVVRTDLFGGSADDARAVAIQADGKIVAAGRSSVTAPSDLALARYEGSPSVLVIPTLGEACLGLLCLLLAAAGLLTLGARTIP